MEEKNKGLFQRILGTAILLTLVVGLPLGTWLALQKGNEYRTEVRSELSELGKVKEFSAVSQNGQAVNPALMRGRVSLVNFLPADFQAAQALTERMRTLESSFEDKEEILFLSFIKTDSTSNLADLATQLGIGKNKRWFLLGTDEASWANIAKQDFAMVDPTETIALVDTSLMVRNVYKLGDNKSMGRLLEHVSMLLPKKRRR